MYQICYELRTRGKVDDIATCSVLTASPSSSTHWNALQQMNRVMGVTVKQSNSPNDGFIALAAGAANSA